jgi:acyl transferase domain-containing protein
LLTRQVNLKAIEAQISNKDLNEETQLFDVDALNRLSAELPAGLLAAGLGIGGGCYTLDAACASSLYAIKLACEELVTGRVDAVLTGGVSRPSSQFTQMGFSQLQALSPSGICCPFDQNADGLVVGEGAGMFVLKRLEDAVSAKDHIYAVIRGIGLANDVGGSLLAPDSEGQLRAMRAAYEQAGWTPDQIELIECHGTGTPKGDAVELESLKELWKDINFSQPGCCVIGSVKSNVGHLLTGAGAAGLMKLLLALKNKKLPPTANFKNFDPNLKLENSPIKVLTEASPWKVKPGEISRKCALSAFGFGGIDGHILLEEFIPDKTKVLNDGEPELNEKDDVVIVSIAARAGSCENLADLQKNLFNGQALLNELPENRHPVNLGDSWFKKGSYIDKIQVELGKFRISPKEIPEILPQQLLMLNTVENAISGLKGSVSDRKRWGVNVGINLDFESTNFVSRWAMKTDLKNSFPEIEYTDALKEAISPPLNNSRTVGALGGIVASRVAREFHCGGPSHTFSAAENSGLAALNAAVSSLQKNEIDLAIVGSVDLAGDLRNLLAVDQLRRYSRKGKFLPFDESSDGPFPGEGAVALVLKRKQDAIKNNDRIVAVIKGIGKASRTDFTLNSAADACIRAINEAWQNASLSPARAGLLEASGSGDPDEDFIETEAFTKAFPITDTDGNEIFYDDNQLCALASCKTVVGHTGCASGLFSLARAALAIYQETIPAMPGLEKPIPALAARKDFFFTPNRPQYWFRNRINGPRTAAVNSIGLDGSFFHVVLQGLENVEIENDKIEKIHQFEKVWPVGTPEEQPFIIEGDSTGELREKLSALNNLESNSIRQFASDYYFQTRRNPEAKLCIGIVAGSINELKNRVKIALNHINNNPDKPLVSSPETNDRLFFNPEPEGLAGKTVFVFPGSGNHSLGMGTELGLFWNKHLRSLDKKYELLAAQFAPERIVPHRLSWEKNWRDKAMQELIADHNSLVFSHVSLCAFLSDIVRSFEIEPNIIMGYSLGETAGNFATGTWRERDEMVRRMRASNLFTTARLRC